MLPTLETRDTYHRLCIPNKYTLYFSFNNLIAFETPDKTKHVIENLWGATTAKHLNRLEPDKFKRYVKKEFEEKFSLFFAS